MNTLLYSNRVNIPYSVKTNQSTIPLGYNKMMTNVFFKPVNYRNLDEVSNNGQIEISSPISNIQWYKSRIPIQIPVAAPPQEQPPATTTGKMLWGEPVWFLLHTLSYKVKEDIFLEFKDDLIRIIYTICTNLPCPTCSEHAKTYLDRINTKAIQTKEQLKLMLFTFHNVVNKKKGYPFFSYEDCEAKYANAITVNIIQNFMPFFQDKSRSPKLMASDFQKTYIVKMLKDWFQKNIGAFDL